MDQAAKLMVVAGLGLAALGGLLWLASSIPGLRVGRLPGDILIQRDGYSVSIPLATMLLVSALLTLVLWIVGLVRR